jgi:hypothetical protein
MGVAFAPPKGSSHLSNMLAPTKAHAAMADRADTLRVNQLQPAAIAPT